jgi:RHS repeat-associated protein
VNALGQRTGVTSSALPALPSWLWTYDAFGQVVAATSNVSNRDSSYQYDTIGNRQKTTSSLDPAGSNYTSSSTNAYSSIQSSSTAAVLTPLYDFDGNMTSGPVPNAPNANSTLVWDAENRLISCIRGAVITTYQYDAQSRRIAKIAGNAATSITTLYLYDAWNCIVEYSRSAGVSPTFTLNKTRLWGTDLSGSMQGAGGVGGLLLITDHSALLTSHSPTYDGNGNVSEYLTTTGTLAARFEYDPFGNAVANTDARNRFTYRFSTKPRDIETSLYYYGYRYYDPKIGRWLSRDPIEEEGGVNLYGFIGNSIPTSIDVLGLREQTVEKCVSYLFIGHGGKKDPIVYNIKSGCSSAGAVVCFPQTNNPKIPSLRWPRIPTHDERLGAGSVGSKISEQRGQLQNLDNDPALGGNSEGINDPSGEMNFVKAVDNALTSKDEVIKKLCKCCDYYRVVIEIGDDDALKDDIVNTIKKHGLNKGKNVFEGSCPK